nr:MAG TPA: hypothetical protein [Caudoviricetes sp.]
MISIPYFLAISFSSLMLIVLSPMPGGLSRPRPFLDYGIIIYHK